jgi:FkbH-like protein
MKNCSLVVAATFVADPIQSVLQHWARKLETTLSVSFAPYGQVVQQLLDHESILSRNEDGINILLVRCEDWARSLTDRPDSDVEQVVRRASADLADAVRSATARSASATVVVLCPPSGRIRKRLLEDAEESLARMLVLPRTTVVRPQDIEALYPIVTSYDAVADAGGHIPYSPEYFTALGTYLVRLVVGLRRPPVKALVVDCDNTLWNGICGEGGESDRVDVDRGSAELQQFLVDQTRRGALICLCSKNNESDVWEAFEKNAAMPLKRSDIVAWRINWKRKSENLAELAAELNIGIESMAFLDDSAVECAEVSLAHPTVLSLELPEDRGCFGKFLKHVWELDRFVVTGEDRDRRAMYQQESHRERLRTTSLTFDEFLENMGIEVEVRLADAADVPRIAQLTSRTNQFNTTVLRQTEAALHRLLQDRASSCFAVRVRDNFGDYGLVGFVLVEWRSDVAVVQSFILSCRTLGRAVEHRVLSFVARVAAERGVDRLELRFVATAKNEPARAFLDSLGAEVVRKDSDASYSLSAAAASEVRWDTKASPARVPQRGPNRDGSVATPANLRAVPDDRSALSRDIALRHSVDEIRGWMQMTSDRRPDSPCVHPTDKLESVLSGVWKRILRLNALGIDDDVLELGASSIDIVQVSSELYRLLEVEVPVTILFDAPTVAQQARALRDAGVEMRSGREH